MTKEVLKMALEALYALAAMNHTTQQMKSNAINAIKEALSKPQQEPVAYGMWDTMIGCGGRMMYVRLDKGQDGCTVPLYTTPPQRKPLTRGQIREIEVDVSLNPSFDYITPAEQLCRAIEAAHGIKE